MSLIKKEKSETFFPKGLREMDKNNFEEILRTHNQKVFNYLLKMLRHHEDAEDILQETFMAFYSKMDVISEEAYLAYLYRTAHNKALNLIKKRKNQDKYSSNYAEMEFISVDETPEELPRTEREILPRVFSKLPEKYATILEMQFYQKMSYKEIAATLELTERAVDSKLIRAKRKLKKLISQEMTNEDVLKKRGDKNENERMRLFA